MSSTATEFQALADRASRMEGWTVRRTKNGWLVTTPSGETAAWHKSRTSAPRTLANVKARLRRLGLNV